MNIIERIKMVKCMEFIMRNLNDEEIFQSWLTCGVADGDIAYGSLDIHPNDLDNLDYYIEDDNFADLMGLFTNCMARAKKSGGLYCDNVVDSNETNSINIDKDGLPKSCEGAVNEALTILDSDDDFFCDMVEVIDDINGYAEGFRCFDMEKLDDRFADLTISEFISLMDSAFCINDDYFFFSSAGVESTSSKVSVYRDNVDTENLLKALIENKSKIPFCKGTEEFQHLLNIIIEAIGEANDY